MRSIILISIVAGILCCGGISANAAAPYIQLKDGTCLYGCDYRVDDTYKTIGVYCEDEERTVSFTEVVIIVDAQGRDVTEHYLGEYYRPQESVDTLIKKNTSPVHDSSKAGVQPSESENSRTNYRPFSALVTIRGLYRAFANDYFQGIESSFGYAGEVVITVDGHQAIRLTYARSSSDAVPQTPLGTVVLSNSLSYKQDQISISYQYYDWPRWRTTGSFMLFSYFGLGVTRESTEGEALLYNIGANRYNTVTGGGTEESRFSLTGGMGVLAMLSSRVGVNLSGNYDIMILSTHQYKHGYALSFDVRLGLTYLLRHKY